MVQCSMQTAKIFWPVGAVEREDVLKCFYSRVILESGEPCMPADMFLISANVPARKKMTGGVD